jgi:hypothetical protein
MKYIKLLIPVIVVMIIAGCGTDMEGTVQDKVFTKGTTSVGTGVSSSGKAVTTVHNSFDEYTIFVNDEPINVSNHEYFKVDKGDYVKIEEGKIVKVEKVNGKDN